VAGAGNWRRRRAARKQLLGRGWRLGRVTPMGAALVSEGEVQTMAAAVFFGPGPAGGVTRLRGMVSIRRRSAPLASAWPARRRRPHLGDGERPSGRTLASGRCRRRTRSARPGGRLGVGDAAGMRRQLVQARRTRSRLVAASGDARPPKLLVRDGRRRRDHGAVQRLDCGRRDRVHSSGASRTAAHVNRLVPVAPSQQIGRSESRRARRFGAGGHGEPPMRCGGRGKRRGMVDSPKLDIQPCANCVR